MAHEMKKMNGLKKYQKNLIRAAEMAMKNAYNPYSKFYVGAALLTVDNKIITGANFENASYGVTICAERSAILHANAEGYRQFKAMAIITKGEKSKTETPTAPCGACRQMIFEASQISGNDIELVLSNTDKTIFLIKNISELLPYAFGPKDLGIDLKKYKRADKS
jgi:cytidine deaminase